MKRTLAAAIIAMVLVAGCSDSDEGSGSSGSSDAQSPGAPSGTPGDGVAPEVDAGDEAAVAAALLTLADFEPGWTAEPADEDDDDDDRAGKMKVAECVGVPYEDLYNDAHATADSPEFTGPEDQEVSNTVGLATTEQWMLDAFEITKGERFRECLLEGMTEEISDDEEVTLGEIELSEMSFDRFGDDTSAFRMTIPLEASGLTFEAVADMVVVRVGRGQVMTSAFSMGSPVDADELAVWVEAGVDRLAAQLAASS